MEDFELNLDDMITLLSLTEGHDIHEKLLPMANTAEGMRYLIELVPPGEKADTSV